MIKDERRFRQQHLQRLSLALTPRAVGRIAIRDVYRFIEASSGHARDETTLRYAQAVDAWKPPGSPMKA